MGLAGAARCKRINGRRDGAQPREAYSAAIKRLAWDSSSPKPQQRENESNSLQVTQKKPIKSAMMMAKPGSVVSPDLPNYLLSSTFLRADTD